MERNKIAKLANKLIIELIKTDLPNKEINRLNDIVADIRDEAINYIPCCEMLKDKNEEISDLAKAFINEVDKKHPFVKLPEEEDFYMARHKLAEKLT